MLINSHLWISRWWIAQQRRLWANISKCALTGLRHFHLKQPTTSTVRRRMCLNVFQSSAIFAPKVPEAIWWHFHRTRRWQQMAHFTGMNKCKQLNVFHWICKMSRQCQVHFYFHSKFLFSSWIPPGWMKVGLLVDVSSFSFVSICSASQTIYFGWNWKIVEALSSIKTAGMRWPLFRGSIPSLGGDSYIPIRWSGRSMPGRSIIINNQIKPIKEMTWQFQFRASSRPALHSNFQRWIKRNWKHSLGNIKESMKLFNLYGNDIWPKAEKRVMGQLHICLNFQLESGFDCIIPR